jgi:hypothetical protein
MMNDDEKTVAAAAMATLQEASDATEPEASHLEVGTDLEAAAVEDVPDDLPRDAEDSTTNNDDDGGNSEISSTSSDAARVEVQLDNDEDRSGNDEGALLYGSPESNENFHPTAQAVYPEVVANHRIQQEVAERKKNIAVAEMVVTNEEAQVPHPHESFNQKNYLSSLCNTRNKKIIVSVLVIAIIIVISVLATVLATRDNRNNPPPPYATVSPEQVEIFVMVTAALEKEGINSDDFLLREGHQYKAFEWLTKNTNLQSMSRTQKLQRYALAALYYATNNVANDYATSPGPWTNESLWLSDETECDWAHVHCDPENKTQKLIFQKNNLSGKLPPELALIRDPLHMLDLISNMIHMKGTDFNVFDSLHNLKHLDLEDNFLEANTGLPQNFKSLTSLEEFKASYNLMSGPLNNGVLETLQKLSTCVCVLYIAIMYVIDKRT